MLKGLKATMYVIGVVGVLFGLSYILIPQQLGEFMGFQTSGSAGYLPYFLASMGGLMIVGSAFILIAAGNPLRHVLWVKYAIAWSLVGLVLEIYSVIVEHVTFSEAMGSMIIYVVFALALFIFYPYKAVKESQ